MANTLLFFAGSSSYAKEQDVRESSSDPHCIFWCCHIWWRFYCDKNLHFVLTFLTNCVGVLLQLVLGCPYLEGKG
jgi:hypothetical protein